MLKLWDEDVGICTKMFQFFWSTDFPYVLHIDMINKRGHKPVWQAPQRTFVSLEVSADGQSKVTDALSQA